MSKRNVLVVGATGKQGSAFVRAGITAMNGENDSPEVHFLALTRDVSSGSAKKLAALGDKVTLVSADLDKPDTVRKVFEDAKSGGGVWGVYMSLAFPGLGMDASGEERQGKVRIGP